MQSLKHEFVLGRACPRIVRTRVQLYHYFYIKKTILLYKFASTCTQQCISCNMFSKKFPRAISTQQACKYNH